MAANINQTEPIQLVFKDLDYQVEVVKRKKCKKEIKTKSILNKLNGVVEPGTILAIMGPSGSGKTTLLNILAGRISNRKWTGSIKINGKDMDRHVLKECAGYVPQADILIGPLTVFEHLMLYADMNLPKNVTKEEKLQICTRILEDLRLTKTKNQFVGYADDDAAQTGLNRGLSGGERKRLSIGLQLVSNPSMLFLDEPTTGLDSYSAESVCRLLSQLAKEGRTIIVTIHQPSNEILSLFDNLMLLAHGKPIYFGPIQSTLEYFDGIGYPCPVDDNPADFYLRLVHINPETGENTGYDNTEEAADVLHKHFLESKYNDYSKQKRKTPPLQEKKIRKTADFWRQFGTLLGVEFTKAIKEPRAIRAGLIQSIISSLIMGIIYLNLGFDQDSIQNRGGALFFICINALFGGMFVPFRNILIERRILFFHLQEGLYHCLAPYLAKFLINVPETIIVNLIGGTIFYFMVHLQYIAAKVFIFYGLIILTSITAISMGNFLMFAFQDPTIAQTIMPMLFVPMMVFSGFYSNNKAVPVYFIWAPYISLIQYSFASIAINEFTGLHFTCTKDELKQYNGVCPYNTGEDYLNFRELQNLAIWENVIVLASYLLFYLVLGFIILKGRAKAMNS